MFLIVAGCIRYSAPLSAVMRCRRPRIKGRFAKAGELAEYLAANPGVMRVPLCALASQLTSCQACCCP